MQQHDAAKNLPVWVAKPVGVYRFVPQAETLPAGCCTLSEACRQFCARVHVGSFFTQATDVNHPMFMLSVMIESGSSGWNR
jgi:hypothetical protein